jgi:hypothetical protein
LNSFQQLLQMGQQVQARLNEIQTQLARQTVSGSSGGGMVTALADGRGRIREIKIEPSAVRPDEVEMLEELVLAAVADAQAKARRLYEEELSRITGGLAPWNLGGLFGSG